MMTPDSNASFNHQIITLSLNDKNKLYESYMSFVENGGMFIPTKREFNIGDEVFVLIDLPEEEEKQPVVGKVVWVTPEGAQGNREAGIGIQFGEDESPLRQKIETYLAGAISSDRPTKTM